MSSELSHSEELKSVFEKAADFLAAWLRPERLVIVFQDPPSGHPRCWAGRGMESPDLWGSGEVSEASLAEILREGLPLFKVAPRGLPTYQGKGVYDFRPGDNQTLIGTPLWNRAEQIVGALYAEAPLEAKAFTADHLKPLRDFAGSLEGKLRAVLENDPELGKEFDSILAEGPERFLLTQLNTVEVDLPQPRVAAESSPERSTQGHSHVADFYRQAGTSLEAGMALPEVLENLSSQAEFAAMVEDLRENRPERALNGFEVALIRMAEPSGNLANALERLAKFCETRQKTLKTVISALTQPTVVATPLAVLLVLFLFPWDLLGYQGAATRALHLARSLASPTGLLVTGLSLAYLIRLLNSSAVLEQVLGWGQDLPGVGPILKVYGGLRILQRVEVALSLGLPPRRAFSMAVEHSSNPRLQVLELDETLTAGLKKSNLFSARALEIFEGAEQSGKLEQRLGLVMRQLEEELERKRERLSSLSVGALVLLALVSAVAATYP